MGGVATAPRRLETGPNVQLDVLRYRFAACTLGAAMTLPGIYFTYVTFVRETIVVSMGPLLLTFGLLLLVMGATCCFVAIRRGEPPIPNRGGATRYISTRPSTSATTVHTSTTTHIWTTQSPSPFSAPRVVVSGTNVPPPLHPAVPALPPYSEQDTDASPPSYWQLYPLSPPYRANYQVPNLVMNNYNSNQNRMAAPRMVVPPQASNIARPEVGQEPT